MMVAIICGMITTASESDNQNVTSIDETVQPVPETIAETPAEEYTDELTPEEAMAIREGELAEEAALSEEEEEEVLQDYLEDENIVYEDHEDEETVIDDVDPMPDEENPVPNEQSEVEPVIEKEEIVQDRPIPEPVATPKEDIIEPVQTTQKDIFVHEGSSEEVKKDVAQTSLKGKVNQNGFVFVGEDRAGDEVTVIF